MNSLETEIEHSLAALEVPDVDLVVAVLAQLPTRQRRRVRPREFALALVSVLVCAAVLTVAPARSAVADWLGIGATDVRPVDEVDLPEAESVDNLGEPATTSVPFGLDPLPPLGRPDAVFDDADRGRSYTWDATGELPSIADSNVAVVLSVRPADRVLSSKTVAAEVGVSFQELDHANMALWLDGRHVLVQAGSSRPVVANQVLLWVTGDVEYRLETALGLDEVVALANDVIGGTDLLAPG